MNVMILQTYKTTEFKPVWRSALLSCELEQVVSEENRHLVVL